MTKHRQVMFGLAVLWIFFRHTFFYNQISYSFISTIVNIGDCGVDIFLFLSGFGLFFSFKKCETILDFYKKRGIRILPTVILLLGVFAIVIDWISDDRRYVIFSPKYWFYAVYSSYWFIGAILFFYIVYPLLFKLVKKNPIGICIVSLILSVLGIILIHSIKIDLLNQMVVYLARITVFVLGIVFAYKQELLMRIKLNCIIFLLSIPLLFILPKDFQRIAYFPLAIVFSVYLPLLLDKLPQLLIKPLNSLGKVSLEFYLIHVFLFSIGIINLIQKMLNINIYISVVLSFVVVLALSLLCSFIVSKMTSIIKK